MLPKAALVAARAAIESLYEGTFDVVEHRKVLRPNHTTGFEDVVVLEKQPCRLSFSSSPSAGDGLVAEIEQKTRLFFAPEISIKEGSKIIVTQHGVTTAYQQSGTTAVYASHNEINLELFERWA